MKKCQYCAEEIQDEAIRCKHCGVDLQTVSRNTQNKKISLYATVIVFFVFALLASTYFTIKSGLVAFAKEKYGYTDNSYTYSLISYNFSNAKLQVTTSDGKHSFVRQFMKGTDGKWQDDNALYDIELGRKMNAALNAIQMNLLSSRFYYDPVGSNETKQQFRKLVEEEKAINPTRGAIYNNILNKLN